jgi:hypothetical protein
MESMLSVRIAVVKDCIARPGGPFAIDLDVLTGFNEVPKRQQERSPKSLRTGAVVAYSPGRLEVAADLTPYCIYHQCPKCGRDELFYLTKRKRNRSDHFAFATGHELRLKPDQTAEAAAPLATLGMEPLSARRTESAQGWRASWADLAPRSSRLAARSFDVAFIAAIGVLLAALLSTVGLGSAPTIVIAVVVALAYEPVAALRGGTLAGVSSLS